MLHLDVERLCIIIQRVTADNPEPELCYYKKTTTVLGADGRQILIANQYIWDEIPGMLLPVVCRGFEDKKLVKTHHEETKLTTLGCTNKHYKYVFFIN